MAKILREPASAARQTYDLIIVGGGIYGAMLCLEASRRGLHSLLIERHDFGGATSFNSLRIIHGGLRYLQNLDFHRFFESVGERRWFLNTFPSLVKPLPCLMPLYGGVLRSPFLLRVVLCANDIFSSKRNHGLRPDRHLPSGKVINPKQTREIFPEVDEQRLKGGAVWYDACMPDSQRLLIETLRWACQFGATALNYVEAQELRTGKKAVAGVGAMDRESGACHEFKARIVVNAAGPWCREAATRFHQDQPALFKPSLAWNVLLNRNAFSDHALAVAPRKKSKARVYFLCPWKGKLFAGTGHAARHGTEKRPMPTTEELQDFLDDLNIAIPSLQVHQDDIVHIFPGFLPVTEDGSVRLTTREVIFDHAKHDGPKGLYSISGVKFTTARLVAEKTLNRIFVKRRAPKETGRQDFRPSRDAQNGRGVFPFDLRPSPDDLQWKVDLQPLILEEAVQHLDDLILRRTTLWDDPLGALEIAQGISGLFDWSDTRRTQELARLKKSL